MFKKIALFGAAACFAVSTAASATGLYVGAGVGYQILKHGVTDTDATSSASFSQFGDGAIGTLFVGYGFCLSNTFWLGLEFNGELAGTKSTATFTDSVLGTDSIQNKAKGGYGLSVRPGYFTSPQTMIYGILGWQRTKFETNEDLNGVNVFSSSNWKNGFRYGGGMQTNLTNQLSLRAEFAQTRYKTRNFTMAAGDTLSVKNQTSQVIVSAVWTFGDVANLGNALGNLTA